MYRQVKFCYRKIIDASSSKAWERLVHEDSYAEFKMQAQRFNPGNKHSTFSEILQHDANAEQLHFLVGNAILPCIKHLGEKIPDVLNTLGRQFLLFKHFRFEIINSHITEQAKHIAAINFYSEPMEWIGTVGGTMLLSATSNNSNGEILTETFIMPPFASIYSIQN